MEIIKDSIKNFFSKKVVKDFTAIVGSNILLRPIQLIKGITVAKYLGPADYGLLKAIELIQMLNKYGSLGFNTAAMREAGNAIGKNDQDKLSVIRNTSYSSEIVLTLVLFFIGICSSLFVQSNEIAILITLASFGLLFSKLRGILATEATILKNFVLISQITFITVTVASLIVIITVPYYKIYSVLFTNVFIGLLALIFYIKVLRFRMKFQIEGVEFKRIIKISIPLAINTFSMAIYKYLERILLLIYLGDISLGIYSFSLVVVDQISIIFKASIKVRIQDIFEGLGEGKYIYVHRMVIRETLLLTFLSILIIPVVSLLIDYSIPIFLDEWTQSIHIIQLLLFSLPFFVILNYPGAVLMSSLINKQSVMAIFRFGQAALLTMGTLILNYYNIINLENFAILNIFCIAYYNIIVILFYKIYFVNKYILTMRK